MTLAGLRHRGVGLKIRKNISVSTTDKSVLLRYACKKEHAVLADDKETVMFDPEKKTKPKGPMNIP